jgi:hypothetical protein
MFLAPATATESPFANHSTRSCFATANSFLKDFLVKKGHNRLFRSQRGPIKYFGCLDSYVRAFLGWGNVRFKFLSQARLEVHNDLMGCDLLAGKYGLYRRCSDVRGGQKCSPPPPTSRGCDRWSIRGVCRRDKTDWQKDGHISETLPELWLIL